MRDANIGVAVQPCGNSGCSQCFRSDIVRAGSAGGSGTEVMELFR